MFGSGPRVLGSYTLHQRVASFPVAEGQRLQTLPRVVVFQFINPASRQKEAKALRKAVVRAFQLTAPSFPVVPSWA